MKKAIVFMLVILVTAFCLPLFMSGHVIASSKEEESRGTTWNSYAYNSSTVSTPGGLQVGCRIYTQEMSVKEIENALFIDNEFWGEKTDYTKLGEPTLRYNCYSYAFYSRDMNNNNVVLMSPSTAEQLNELITDENAYLHPYWLDAHFTKVPKLNGEAQVGDVVLYYSSVTQKKVCHAAVVSQVNNGNVVKVISKWGRSALYEHRVEEVPRDYRATEGRTGYGEAVYEVFSYKINHSYGTWSSTSATKHRRDCQIGNCSKYQTGNHSLSYTGHTSSSHIQGCSVCNYSKTSSHSYNCTYSGSSSTHNLACNCGYSKSESHTKTWTSVDNTKHRWSCAKCDHTSTKLDHSFGAWSNEGVSGHSHTCSLCKKKVMQAHIYNGVKCTICGYTGNGVAPNIQSIAQKHHFAVAE